LPWEFWDAAECAAVPPANATLHLQKPTSECVYLPAWRPTQPAARAALAACIPNERLFVEASAIKVIGELRKTPWQRFSRLQRTAARLAQGRGQPKGVFKFASNEACTAWTANLNRKKN